MFGRSCVFDVLPPNGVRGLAFPGDGAYLAAAHDGAPFLTIYKRAGEVFTKLFQPDTAPTAYANSCSFTVDGLYLAVTYGVAPYINIYKRSGDTFTKLPDPAILPAGNANGCAFSADGVYLAVAHLTSPYITIYKRSGDTFTKLSNPSVLPSGDASHCSFTPDGVYLAVTVRIGGGGAGTKTPTVYKRSGDTFTALSELPDSVSGGYGFIFSPDGFMLGGGSTLEPTRIYARSGDSFTVAKTLSEFWAQEVDFSQDGLYMAAVAAQAEKPGLWVYQRDGLEMLDRVTIAAPVQEGGWSCTFDPSSSLIIVGLNAPPYITGRIIDSDAIPGKPISLAPKDTYISINDSRVFSWEHINASGTAPTGADLQYRRPDGVWQGLTTIVGDESSATIPADTFEAGSYQWRVRTYNQDGYPGEWSDPAAFMAVGVPATPLIAGATNSSRPVVTWSAGSQQGYQMQITQGDTVIWDSLETSGIVQTRKVPKYLASGEYKARVRIINASMLWSAWAEQEFTIDVTGPAKPTLTAEATAGAAVLTLTAPDAEKLYLVRDGIPIANVTGKTEYTDHAALGSAVYVLRAVDASDNYTDSDPVAVTVSVPQGMVATLAAVDDLANPVALKLTRGVRRSITGSKIRDATYHHYAGREYPVARYSGHSTGSYELSVAFISALDRDRLLDLLDRRRTMLYRDKWGNRWYVAIPDNGYEQDRIATSLTLSMHVTDYVEQIDYEV